MATTEVPTHTDAEDTDIRPFEIGFPDEDLADLRRRVKATRWPERETVDRRLTGRAARADAAARALLGGRVRLAQVRGAVERSAELHNRD